MLSYSKKELSRMTDSELIQLMISNDKTVIEFVFFEKCKFLFNYIIKEIFSNQIEKDELINELYLFLRQDNWQKVRNFQGRSKFTTWLSVIAVRFFLKKKASLTESDTFYPIIPELAATYPCRNTYEEMISKMDLINAIHRLKSPRDRFVIFSMEIEGYGTDEVASQLNITKANLYNIRKRAFKRLSKLLTDYSYVNK